MLMWKILGLLGVVLFVPAAHAAREIAFELETDSSKQLAQAAFWQEFRNFGSNYRCTFHIVRPELGEAPLKTKNNHFICKFIHPDGSTAQQVFEFGDTTVGATGKTANSLFFETEGEVSRQMLNTMALVFHKFGATIPDGLLWDREVDCNALGVCKRIYTLNTKKLPQGNGEKIAQIYCGQVTSLAGASKVHLDRDSFANSTLYYDELIYQQSLAGERVMEKTICGFFPITDATQNNHDSDYRGRTNSPNALDVEPPKAIQFKQSDLRDISFYWPSHSDSPMKKYAVNAYQSEQGVNSFLNRTLSMDGYRYAVAFQLGTYYPDDRTIRAMQLSQPILKKLYFIFEGYNDAITVLMHSMTLIPDPDRWFFLASLASIDWQVVSQVQFNTLLPKEWAKLGDLVISRRVGNRIYVNKAFLDKHYYDTALRDGFDNWLLWEAVKLWTPKDPNYDFENFGMRFSRSMMAGNFNEFRVKDAKGKAALTFLELTDKINHDVRATSEWPWNPENTYYRFEPPVDPHNIVVRFYTPALVEEVGGKGVKDTTSLQYTDATPGSLDSENRANDFDMRLFCNNLGERFPAKVRLTPRRGRIFLNGTDARWSGVETLQASVTTVTVNSLRTCQPQLSDALQTLHQNAGRDSL